MVRARWQVKLLGPVCACRDDGQVAALAGPIRLALLACLAMHAPRVVSRAALVAGLWGEDPPPTATNTLQAHISALRRSLGHDAIVTASDGYRLAPQCSVDVAEFERLRAHARAELAAGHLTAASRALTKALSLRRGSALGGTESTPFGQATQHGSPRGLCQAVVEERIETDLTSGPPRRRPGRALTTRAPPAFERICASEGLLAVGQADALAAYESARRTLHDELGLDPSPALRHLHGRLLTQTEPVHAGPPPGT